MKVAVMKVSDTRVRIVVERPGSKITKNTTFEYIPIDISADDMNAVCLIVTPTGDGVDRISFIRLPAFKVTDEEVLANLILAHLTKRGFDLEKIDELVYETNLGTGIMSATAVQYGYYDEYAGISIEK